MYMYVCLSIYDPSSPGPPLPHRCRCPPPVGWAAQVPIGSIAVGPHPWSCTPLPPCGMWGGGSHGMGHAYNIICMHAMHAYVDMETPEHIFIHSIRWGSPSPHATHISPAAAIFIDFHKFCLHLVGPPGHGGT
jgi:hypothetical protein